MRVEFDQCAPVHIDGFDQAGHAGESPQLRTSFVDNNVFVGKLLFQFLDMFKNHDSLRVADGTWVMNVRPGWVASTATSHQWPVDMLPIFADHLAEIKVPTSMIVEVRNDIPRFFRRFGVANQVEMLVANDTFVS